MNPNFYNQQKEDAQKNPFLNNAPFGSQQPNMFGGQQAPAPLFGSQQPQQQSSLFGGQQNAAPFGSAPQGFGSNAGSFGAQTFPPKDGMFSQTPSLFGKPTEQPVPFGNASSVGVQNGLADPFKTQTSLFGGGFGAQNANGFGSQPFQVPFGTQAPAQIASTQPANPFGVAPAQPAETGPFGTSQNAFGAQSMGQSQQAPFGTVQTKPEETQMTTAPGSASFSSSKPAESPAPSEPVEEKSRPTSVFNQPGEKNISFLQMTLNEIIQQQTRKLEENIKTFKEKAKEVFDQDERIIRALNNYKIIKNKIDEEERIIAETEENVDFFEKWLSEFQKEVPDGTGDELLACIRELERVSDRYNKAIEALRDEEDEVMCLVNENYNLICVIDEKLDILERH